MPAPPRIIELVAAFGRNLDAYRSGAYNETQVRHEFIDPLFAALGWDVNNEQGYAEAYKDVIHEDAIKVGGATEAPDYCFRIGGARKFFVEAKKPSVDIESAVHPAFQLRRYAWSAKLPLSILTDFDEFAVYDCRVKPVKTDGAATARTMFLRHTDYVPRWDELSAIFSREAVLRGSFDRYAESTRAKKGTAEVDDAFLADIESWRDALARNLAVRNPRLSTRELNFAVQRTIDRIVFLRICEDRGVEPYGRLQALLNGAEVYPRLAELFRRADERYNSGLFHFHPERDRAEAPDELTLNLAIDDKVLKDLLRSLYYPDSPYEFSVLSADILGQVYEQFLGKVIRVTAGHHAVVEDKPEVKKAGGVYYTPTYIVDYIAANTVGKLLEGKTPNQVAKLRILDPACGSGSFLIGAYQRLLDWHRDWYQGSAKDDEGVLAASQRRTRSGRAGGPEQDLLAASQRRTHSGRARGPEDWAKGRSPRLYQAAGGEWRLTTGERKRILLNNIYGVDIDPQAVEVTKLSLLLKVLEGENDQTLAAQLRLFHERALPDLGRNIKCGNSLIGPDFYQNHQLDLLDNGDRYRVNVFDWGAEFAEIMGSGGFDAVIGNPPYIRIQGMKEWAPLEVEYYKRHYASAAQGNYDIYVVFAERGLGLLNPTGHLGFILPHKFFNAQYGASLREMLSQGRHLSHIVHFGSQQVFAGATTYTCLLFLDKAGCRKCRFVSVPDLQEWVKTGAGVRGEIAIEKINGEVWNITVGDGAGLVARLDEMPARLADVADIFVGLQTSADDVFILEPRGETVRTLRLHSTALNAEVTLEKGLLHPLVSGTDVQGYAPLPNRQYILFPYEVTGESARLIPFDEVTRRYPRTAKYFLDNKRRLRDREKGKFRDRDWHRLGRTQNVGIQGRVKVCVPRLVDRLCAGFDAGGSHYLDNVDVGGVTLKPDHARQDLRYILGLLNSRLLAWYFPHISAPFRGGWWSANRQFLSQVPVRLIDFSDRADVRRHEQVVRLVGDIQSLHKHLAAARTPQEQTGLQRQIDATARQIDRLVYELYALTADEVRVVEGAAP